jgi:hypothetical protein
LLELNRIKFCGQRTKYMKNSRAKISRDLKCKI